ncbi:cell wall-binding repeat-containing protein [Kineococcus sp. SYSU DK005]|uniref:cell wall-binding repeat-containing protein n=1 Tax=Kineococcus sp. SYSU DK005 TaxID=3383126 RepID=UPI003D7E62D8
MKTSKLTPAVAVLVGLGAALAGAGPAQAAPGFAFDQRISGPDRFATAVAASKLLSPVDGSATDVVVVNGYATVDGLTASYLAGLRSAPVLYTDTRAVPAVTTAEIDRLGVEHVWIVGGTDRVPAAQQQAWEAAGLEVTRLAGADRYETAALVAQVDDEHAPEQVFIASGTATADALAAGPVAWARNHPILLTAADSVPAPTAAALRELGTANRVVLGSPASVSESTYTALGGTQRIGGADRQATAAAIAQDAIATENFDPQSVALTGGTDATAADALAAAPVAGSQGVPLLFTGFDGGLGAGTTAYLTAQKANYTRSGNGWVFGGEPSVRQATADAATAAVQ